MDKLDEVPAPDGDLISRIDHDREWIIGCIKHDGFIHTHRFDKANQIILEALEPKDGDLISRSDAIEAVKETLSGNVYWDYVCDTVKAIKALPSAEAVQGEWIAREDWNGDSYYDCSVCGESFVLFDGTPSMNLYHYCPNCGARMYKGGEQNDD